MLKTVELTEASPNGHTHESSVTVFIDTISRIKPCAWSEDYTTIFFTHENAMMTVRGDYRRVRDLIKAAAQ
jgi:hypothetical protein